MRKFCFVFVLFGFNLYPQEPDLTTQKIYNEVIPGFKQDHQEQKEQGNIIEDPKINQDKERETQHKQQNIFENFFENKTYLNLTLLFVLIIIFVIYRFRR
ncbi:MAG: hypothetical protein ACK4UJ_00545 [Leptonema sp. (in: bacteria)]